eukprot:5083362-Alexandrium_andersonii.AAC.1
MSDFLLGVDGRRRAGGPAAKRARLRLPPAARGRCSRACWLCRPCAHHALYRPPAGCGGTWRELRACRPPGCE